MTLDEVIKHAEEVAEEHNEKLKVYENTGEDRLLFSKEETECRLCATEHRQLAEWLKELKQLREQTRWIPISERLPDTDTDVLVTNGIGTYIGWIDPTDKGWRVDSESEYFMNDIVAWMPLPEPYKAESEE